MISHLDNLSWYPAHISYPDILSRYPTLISCPYIPPWYHTNISCLDILPRFPTLISHPGFLLRYPTLISYPDILPWYRILISSTLYRTLMDSVAKKIIFLNPLHSCVVIRRTAISKTVNVRPGRGEGGRGRGLNRFGAEKVSQEGSPGVAWPHL
jgi:hypothetical protein